MPVAQMKKIHISAMKKDKQRLVEYLQRQESVEIEEHDASQSLIFARADCSEEINRLQANHARAKEALEILERRFPEKASLFEALEGQKVKTVSEYESYRRDGEPVLQIAESVCAAEHQLLRAQDELARLREKKESLHPWLALRVPLGFTGTAHTSAFIGALPQGFTSGKLEEAIAAFEADPGQFVFQILFSDKEQTCLLAVSMRKKEKELESILEKLQFSAPPLTTEREPHAELAALDTLIKEKNDWLEALEKELSLLSEHKGELRFLLDYCAIRLEGFGACGQIGESEYVFLLTGYLPAKELERIRQGLAQRFLCAVRDSDVTDADEAPILMENNRFSQPVESIVASYNVPGYGEIDPTKMTSFFYYFMFGLMFSDACYGAILALACGGLLLKFRKMKESTARFLRLFFWCGVSTLAWGIVFSSYFGDVVDVFSEAFLGQRYSIAPLWFAPLEQPMRLLLFCLAIGIAHLTTGYGMNLYTALRGKDFKGAVFDSLMPVLFLFSLMTVFMGTEMFKGLSGFSVSISPLMENICLAAAGVCAAGILLMAGRESKNWGKRLLKGIFGLYNVIAGWISDILSYSRLLALGLATGVIGSVINTLAAMSGSGVIGFVFFLVIFAAGHAMNFGINILGSYVHSNRLEYVEFFGKFYQGGGRPFRPLGLNTKYYTIREEK